MGTSGNGSVRPAAQTVIVGYHAPARGAHTGVADYAGALETALGKLAEVRRNAAEADIHLYHVGNNRLHESIYRRALETPGVIVLHDAVLHHFMLGALTEQEYIEEFVYNYGEWRRETARELWMERARSGVDPRYFCYPMLRRIVERSQTVIVHNPGAAAMVRDAAAREQDFVFIVPHLYSEDPAVDGAAFRKRIGFGENTILFGIFGYLREPKRISASIAAFRRLNALRSNTALLLAGEAASKDLERLLQFEAAHPAMRRVAHLSETEFASAIQAADCCINLRYPAAGETSGIAIRAMGAAKPVILTESVENSAFPEEACLRVTPGPGETTELFELMGLICDFPGVARRIGAAAQRYIRQMHAPDRVANLYLSALERVAAAQAVSPG